MLTIINLTEHTIFDAVEQTAVVCRDTPPDTPLRDGRLDRIYYYCREWD